MPLLRFCRLLNASHGGDPVNRYGSSSSCIVFTLSMSRSLPRSHSVPSLLRVPKSMENPPRSPTTCACAANLGGENISLISPLPYPRSHKHLLMSCFSGSVSTIPCCRYPMSTTASRLLISNNFLSCNLPAAVVMDAKHPYANDPIAASLAPVAGCTGAAAAAVAASSDAIICFRASSSISSMDSPWRLFPLGLASSIGIPNASPAATAPAAGSGLASISYLLLPRAWAFSILFWPSRVFPSSSSILDLQAGLCILAAPPVIIASHPGQSTVMPNCSISVRFIYTLLGANSRSFASTGGSSIGGREIGNGSSDISLSRGLRFHGSPLSLSKSVASHRSCSGLRCTLVPLITPSSVMANTSALRPWVPMYLPTMIFDSKSFALSDMYDLIGRKYIFSPYVIIGRLQALPVSLWCGVLPSRPGFSFAIRNPACLGIHSRSGSPSASTVPSFSSVLLFMARIWPFNSLTMHSISPFAWWSPVGDSCGTISTSVSVLITCIFSATIECSSSLLKMSLR